MCGRRKPPSFSSLSSQNKRKRSKYNGAHPNGERGESIEKQHSGGICPQTRSSHPIRHCVDFACAALYKASDKEGCGGWVAASDRAHRAGNLSYSRRLSPDARLNYYRVSRILLDHIPRSNLTSRVAHSRIAHGDAGGVRVLPWVHAVLLRVLALGVARPLPEPGQLDDRLRPGVHATESLRAASERDENVQEDCV